MRQTKFEWIFIAIFFSSPFADESSKQNSIKQLPTTKWKRDRRNRNEYSRRSDPKIPENFNGQDGTTTPGSPEQPLSPQSQAPPYPLVNGHSNGQIAKAPVDGPLDMSVRQRGQPPSYTQTINNPGYRSNYRPSVITQNSISRDEPPTGKFIFWIFLELVCKSKICLNFN